MTERLQPGHPLSRGKSIRKVLFRSTSSVTVAAQYADRCFQNNTVVTSLDSVDWGLFRGRERLGVSACRNGSLLLLESVPDGDGFFERAGTAIYSLATNRLLAIAYWISGGLMGIAVATGKWFEYSLIPLSMEIFSAILLIHVIG